MDKNKIDNKGIIVEEDLLEAIRSFPRIREVHHCGEVFSVSPFELYAVCPQCQQKIKLRCFSALNEVEDVFDAVFAWLLQPDAMALALQRQTVIKNDLE